jgi:uncharacterized membrane protein YdbT with pleckstrin-like domain
MSYVKHVLLPDEKIRFITNIHWIKSLPGVLLLLLSGVVYLLSLKIESERLRWLVWLVALALVAASVALLVVAWFKRWTTEIAVTDRRIIYKEGFIRRKTIEMHMDKVESVDVDQSILGRVFGYGDILVRGVGTGFEPLKTFADAIEFRNHVTAE